MRIDKILVTSNSASTLYTVMNLIRYYKKSIGKVSNMLHVFIKLDNEEFVQFTEGGLLATTLTELQDKSEETFILSLQQQVNNALIRVETPPRDLSPTPAINHLLSVLRDMLSTANMSEGRETDMLKVFKFDMHTKYLQ